MASSLLDRNNRQLTSTSPPSPAPVPTAPIIINRIRTGNRFHVFRRRQRRRVHPRNVPPTLSSSSPQPQPTTPVLTSSTRSSSSRTNLPQPFVPPSSPARDDSRESLVSLYWLFQDNINSSRTHIV